MQRASANSTVQISQGSRALPSFCPWKGAREQERGVWTRLSVFSHGVFTCNLHLDELIILDMHSIMIIIIECISRKWSAYLE